MEKNESFIVALRHSDGVLCISKSKPIIAKHCGISDDTVSRKQHSTAHYKGELYELWFDVEITRIKGRGKNGF